MRLSDLKEPTYINRLGSFDPRTPRGVAAILLAVVGFVVVAAFLALPDLGDGERLGLGVILVGVIWSETYLLRSIDKADKGPLS
ncbi:hypothetical protein [Olsenella sp. HMSC062G07]|uniref:hypothetical protein n=1 Tax=Olsenella sp. HMSC062G07 TaxID=1739330 RepID=UPI0008A59551|nr:hypothetical protein [Olsenella sp. HMSC062G07]OFK22398.1 hypothetical protein HMPREF2826_01225 [Olsenella sp. HMSC062G07]